MRDESEEGIPCVSVVIPVRDAPTYLAQAIESVNAQTVRDLELIIVDDASKEAVDSKICLGKYDVPIRIVRHENPVGAAQARNSGVEWARGRYVAFLDADDIWYEKKLEIQIPHMSTNGIGLSCTGYEAVCRRTGRIKHVHPPSVLSYQDLLRTCSIGLSTVVIDRTCGIEPRFEPLRYREDWVLWLSLARRGVRIGAVPDLLMRYSLNASPTHKVRRARETWRLYRKIERIGFIRSVRLFGCYAVAGFRKTY